MAKKVSIYDVAKYVNVSPASVSYVVNGIDKVSKATKEKILKGIKELGYTPNQTAITLSTGQSKLIGLFLPWDDPSIAFLQNPFYGEFIGCLEKQLASHGYDLVIESIKNPSSFESWAQSRLVDGIVMLGKCPKEIYKGIKSMEIPTVLVDVYEDYSKEFCNVRINDEEGSYIATEYLIKKGHKNIGFVCGDLKTSFVDQKRFHGFKHAMENYGIEVKEELIFDTVATFDGGYKIADRILKTKDITAVVCAEDILAIGIVRKYSEKGKSIPDSLSIVGFDDIQASVYIYPALTTIHQDIGEKGNISANLILDDLKEKSLSKKTIILEPYLIERDTVKII